MNSLRYVLMIVGRLIKLVKRFCHKKKIEEMGELSLTFQTFFEKSL